MVSNDDVRDRIGQLIALSNTVPPNLFAGLRVIHDYDRTLIVADREDNIWKITVERLSDDFS
jgi:hypothetical protein